MTFEDEINGCHMAYEGFPHICIGGTITWGERVSGMWVPPHVIVPHGANMRETLICHMICISLSLSLYIYIYIYICGGVREREREGENYLGSYPKNSLSIILYGNHRRSN